MKGIVAITPNYLYKINRELKFLDHLLIPAGLFDWRGDRKISLFTRSSVTIFVVRLK